MAQTTTEQERDYYLLPGSTEKATADEAIRFLLLAENDDQVPKRFVQEPGSDDYIEDPDWLDDDDWRRIHRTRPYSRSLDQQLTATLHNAYLPSLFMGHLSLDGSEKVLAFLRDVTNAIEANQSLRLAHIGFIIDWLKEFAAESYPDPSVVFDGISEGESITFDENDSVDDAWRWLDDYCEDRQAECHEESNRVDEHSLEAPFPG